MSDYTWPTEQVFYPQTFQWGAVDKIGRAESQFTGAIQTSGPPYIYRWKCAVGWPPASTPAIHHRRVGWLAKIRREHRVLIPCFSLLAPIGTMRGSPIVNGALAQGARQANITTTGAASQTLKIGDLLSFVTSIGTQVVMVTGDFTASGNALSNVTFEPPLRGSVSNGTAVGWDAPKPRFILMNDEWMAGWRPAYGEPIAVDFVEQWNA